MLMLIIITISWVRVFVIFCRLTHVGEGKNMLSRLRCTLRAISHFIRHWDEIVLILLFLVNINNPALSHIATI
jgi:ABC-type phosphate/phosphonate transport system permease subunit